MRNQLSKEAAVLPRSDCPINRGVELLGDRWSLVILRDITFCDHRSFRELFTGSQEGITPPTLSKRLSSLVAAGLLRKDSAPRGIQGKYSLTESGIQLVPLLVELARVGHLLDPATRTTEPRFEGWTAGDPRVAAYMDELRTLHL